jgi:hypothetical protein
MSLFNWPAVALGIAPSAGIACVIAMAAVGAGAQGEVTLQVD